MRIGRAWQGLAGTGRDRQGQEEFFGQLRASAVPPPRDDCRLVLVSAHLLLHIRSSRPAATALGPQKTKLDDKDGVLHTPSSMHSTHKVHVQSTFTAT